MPSAAAAADCTYLEQHGGRMFITLKPPPLDFETVVEWRLLVKDYIPKIAKIR